MSADDNKGMKSYPACKKLIGVVVSGKSTSVFQEVHRKNNLKS